MMNPLMVQSRLSNIMSGIQTGQIDAKAEVLRYIKGMSPEQKKTLRPMIEQAQQIAKSCGIDPGNFVQEISGHLS